MQKKPTPEGTPMQADGLADIRDITVDPSLPREERVAEYLRQIRNPFLFRCGKFTVHAKYADSGPSLEDCLRQLLT